MSADGHREMVNFPMTENGDITNASKNSGGLKQTRCRRKGFFARRSGGGNQREIDAHPESGGGVLEL